MPNISLWWFAAMTIPVIAFSGVGLWAVDRRDRLKRVRLEKLRAPIRANLPIDRSGWQHLGLLFAPIIGADEQQRLRKLLAAAGLKGSFLSLVAAKVISTAVAVVLTWSVLELRHLLPVMMFLLAALGVAVIMGWRLPEWILNHLVKRRRLRIEHGIPDALDLLVICAEAGLSLNQAVEEVSRKLRLSNPEVADEFAATSAEMRILSDFGQALDHLVERTGLDNLRGLVATLKQSLKFGTPLAESLRMIASEMRAERQARMEERAARLPVLLAVPMMLFILPCLMMIIATPIVLRIIELFKNITFGAP